MLLGDSSAAGVGVSSQQQALAGQLLEQLQLLPQIQQKFSQLEWSLHATSGHTSFDETAYCPNLLLLWTL